MGLWVGVLERTSARVPLLSLAFPRQADERAPSPHPQLTGSQRKVLNKLFEAGADGFAGGMSTKKFTAIAQVSRAAAYRELTELAALGVLVKSGQGRGTRYALSGALEGVSG